jgi:hypothetical protein
MGSVGSGDGISGIVGAVLGVGDGVGVVGSKGEGEAVGRGVPVGEGDGAATATHDATRTVDRTADSRERM